MIGLELLISVLVVFVHVPEASSSKEEVKLFVISLTVLLDVYLLNMLLCYWLVSCLWILVYFIFFLYLQLMACHHLLLWGYISFTLFWNNFRFYSLSMGHYWHFKLSLTRHDCVLFIETCNMSGLFFDVQFIVILYFDSIKVFMRSIWGNICEIEVGLKCSCIDILVLARRTYRICAFFRSLN